MIELRNILCPIDFSDFSRRALEAATMLARSYQGKVIVMHVTPLTMPPLSGLATAAADALERDERERLRADLLERLRVFTASAAAQVEVEALVEEGHAAGQIVTLARTRPAHLVVMGTHGHGGFEKLILGSTTEKTLLRAPCPVLTIPPASEAASRPFQRILWATDFSESAGRALTHALGLARRFEGRITALHVLEWAHRPRGAATADRKSVV